MWVLAYESLVNLLIPLIYYKAKFNHGCETHKCIY